MQDRLPPTRQNLLATHGRTVHWVAFVVFPLSEPGQLIPQQQPKKPTSQVRSGLLAPCQETEVQDMDDEISAKSVPKRERWATPPQRVARNSSAGAPGHRPTELRTCRRTASVPSPARASKTACLTQASGMKFRIYDGCSSKRKSDEFTVNENTVTHSENALQNFLRPKTFRRPDRQMDMVFDFKKEFCRSRKSSLSGTIGVDRTISRTHRRNGTNRRGGKTTVSIIRSPP
jgi:hypothetical protein